ncbi:MAG: 2-phosphotransferase [Armatimonadetes bacterium]|jgi:putative RNA 2'-phosphotransferase|nr:2-phosphotransferase [Armatimonadota bacterium]
MDTKRIVNVSKYLSRHLRHNPTALGLILEPGGWVRVDDLLAGCSRKGFHISRAELDEVVAQNDKQRFSFDASGKRIRANQGHSVEVDLQLEPTAPPAVLYHGTGHGTAGAVAKEGLRKMRRHHVHLSADIETATRVGARHGRPVVFAIDAQAMAAAGVEFFCSDNGVWLVDEVPAQFLTELSEAAVRA